MIVWAILIGICLAALLAWALRCRHTETVRWREVGSFGEPVVYDLCQRCGRRRNRPPADEPKYRRDPSQTYDESKAVAGHYKSLAQTPSGRPIGGYSKSASDSNQFHGEPGVPQEVSPSETIH